MKHSRRAQICGLGLVTALGDGLDANLAGLRHGEPAHRPRTLDTVGGPVEVPYLSLDPLAPPRGISLLCIRNYMLNLVKAYVKGTIVLRRGSN